MITYIYIDAILFGGISSKMVEHFVQQMQYNFEMSLVGEHTFILVFKWNWWNNIYLSPIASMQEK